MHEFAKTLALMHYMTNTNVCIYANNARGYKTMRYTYDTNGMQCICKTQQKSEVRFTNEADVEISYRKRKYVVIVSMSCVT